MLHWTTTATNRLINSFKTLIACAIGWAIATALKMQPAWILITIIVIMARQLHVGGVLIASWWRWAGTIIGAIIALLAIFVYPAHALLAAFILFTGLFFFSYLSSSKTNINSMGLLGGTTLIILLLSGKPTYQTVMLRFFEISIGILIAFMVSYFILPHKARLNIRYSIAATLEAFIILYQSAWDTVLAQKTFLTYELRFIQSFADQVRIAGDAVHEFSRKHITFAVYQRAIYGERLIFRYICLIHSTLNPTLLNSELPKQMTEFNQKLCQNFQHIANYLKNPNHKIQALVSKNDLLAPMAFMQTTTLASDHRLGLDSFFFCTQSLVKAVRSLSRIITIFDL